MGPTTGVLLGLSVLLAGAGIAKIRDPGPAVRTVAALRLPLAARSAAHPLPVRMLGAAEIVVAGAAVWIGGRLGSALIALVFLAFAAVIARVLSTAAVVDCGCFGAARSPLGRTHLVVDLAFAAAAATGIALPPTPLPEWAGAGPVLLLIGGGALFAALAVQLFTSFPALLQAQTQLTGDRRAQPEA
ncbi:hypothetical protein GIS00_26030 [Nakamurella sp. YIM 132087]|uniref:Methylamine utilisation protein MauE domain-containing protein n=1 Tax=Nakamurella alba TaxID=2665158 RepID=A0A7K1FTB6_9ACTN|nr:MauE/DoxX family redox-associated membrane protein [Nakamurella alba]MTD17395.1 hypothetical protein [Nakamurella alba]